MDALTAQLGIEQQVADLKKLDGDNAKKDAGNAASAQRSAAAKAAADSQLQMGEAALAADKALAEAELTIHRGTIEQKLALDLDFAKRDMDVKTAGNAAEIAALDKTGKDYQNQLKALNEKSLEIQQQYQTAVAQLQAGALVASYNKSLADLEASEREKIAATKEGTAARVAAIDAAIKEEQSRQLQSTNFFHDLLTQRLAAVQQEVDQEKKIRLESDQDTARADQVAMQEHIRHQQEMSRIQSGGGSLPDLGQIAQLQKEANDEYQIKRQALQKEAELYERAGVDEVRYADRTKQQLAALDQAYADQKAELQAQETAALRASWAQIETGYARTFQSILEGQTSLARVMTTMAEDAAGKMIAQSILLINHQKAQQLQSAKTAAAGAYSALSSVPIVGPVLGAVAAATVFAGAMAFQKGGIVPGVGHGDIVPAMLEPGESVIPKRMTENLTKAANGPGTGTTHHFHYSPKFHVNTVDATGVRDMLNKHTTEFERHFNNHIRKMNK